ncbi:MAG: pseudouridine synthase [Candidatus Aphodousia sp.]|nr:pseudouridine synthase [Sutterella sp.]MDY2899004.1 pseudouridine synthase [Candidatus Aphodousia sp.]
MRLEQVLFSQGFGTRHECRGLIVLGRVEIDGASHTDPDEEVVPEGLIFTVDGVQWPYFDKTVVALHKPAGFECSQKPIYHPSVMTLLPSPLRVRGLQPVGRLDEDTTGLLILTDDGALQHRLIHPKRHVPKVYRVTAKHPMTEVMLSDLLQGVMIEGEKAPVKAQTIEALSDRIFDMTLTQGKYHQVKRMVAAVGNRVEALHRRQFGNYALPEDLASGQWCFISKEDILG